MKKITTFTFLIFFVVGLALTQAGMVSAEEAAQPGIRPLPVIKEKLQNIKERVLERKETREASISAKKEQTVARVRQVVIARWQVHNRAVILAENLLNKLQERIYNAKAAGKDTAEMESLMADARTKVADAKNKLEDIKGKKDTAVDKETFREIQNSFQEIRRDLQAVRFDAAQIIRLLKGFNSSTSEGTKSGAIKIKEGTAGGAKRPTTATFQP